jgi:hypothetical protein
MRSGLEIPRSLGSCRRIGSLFRFKMKKNKFDTFSFLLLHFCFVNRDIETELSSSHFSNKSNDESKNHNENVDFQ